MRPPDYTGFQVRRITHCAEGAGKTLPSAINSLSFTALPVKTMPRNGFILVFARWGAKTKLVVQRILCAGPPTNVIKGTRDGT
jgi:hypothetical protein